MEIEMITLPANSDPCKRLKMLHDHLYFNLQNRCSDAQLQALKSSLDATYLQVVNMLQNSQIDITIFHNLSNIYYLAYVELKKYNVV
ncbi:hypothetical protein CEW46_21120 [Bacillus cereus]|nr:hypothetical protein CEW46_21120 [Bacillus cereus]